MKDYIEEEKLYRVYRKKDNHISRKINENGMMTAIQFSDDENALNGPVLIKPVEEEELVSPVYTDLNEARSFKQIIIEDVITPSLQYALECALEIGFEYLSHWAEDVAIPKAKKKSKELWKEAKIIMSGVKDGLAGKEIKASQLLKECERLDLSVEVLETSVEYSECEKVLRSPEEVMQMIDAMKNSANIIAAGIRMLSNTVIAYDGSNPECRIEMQRNLEVLSSEVIMKQIDLLLEEKNHDLLDEVSMRMLTAFKEGNFIVNGEAVPISNYVYK